MKEILDLGKGKWKPEFKNNLFQAILSVFDGCFPFNLANDEIYNQLFQKVGIKEYNGQERKKKDIIEEIDRIKDAIFFTGPFQKRNVIVLPEWTSYDQCATTRGIDKSLMENEEFKKFFHKYDDDKENGHTLSSISLEQLNDGTIFFSLPTVFYADYAPVFEAIYSCFENIEGPTKNADFRIYESESYIELPIEEEGGKKNALLHAVYYLFDLIIGFLASNKSTTSRGQSDKLDHCLRRIKKLGLDYQPNEQLLQRIRARSERCDESDTESETLIRIIDNIWWNNKEKVGSVIVLPRYSVSTTILFEQYVFAVLSNVYIDLKKEPILKEPIQSADKESCERKPDMITDDDKIIFDAKNKYEYGEAKYCDLEDVNRMARYLLLKNKRNNWFSNYIGCFIYPNMSSVKTTDSLKEFAKRIKKEVESKRKEVIKSKDITVQRVITKVGLPFPIRLTGKKTL